MDSSGLGRAVITARPPPGAGSPPHLRRVQRGSPEADGGEGGREEVAARFPVYTTGTVYTALPPRPRSPGPEVYPGRGLAGGSEDPPRRPAGA